MPASTLSPEQLVLNFYFFNSSQALGLGFTDQVWLTTNGGGISKPKAFFEANTTKVCSSNIVELINKSHEGYIYKWYRNGVLFSTSYNSSYTITTGIDTIKLVIDKSGITDTLSKIIYAKGKGSLQLNSKPRKDTVCSNSYISFDIFNSNPDISYQVSRSGAAYYPSSNGNGGTLTLNYSTPSREESTTTFLVIALANTGCGIQIDSQFHQVTIVNTFPDVNVLFDTVCTQKQFSIPVANSRPDYLYWIDTSFEKVTGNGNTILLPHKALNIDYNGYTLATVTTDLYIEHKTIGCKVNYPIVEAKAKGRRSYASFSTLQNELFTGDTLKISNQSQEAYASIWEFSDAGTSISVTGNNPSTIYFNTEGNKKLNLSAITKEGCVDKMDLTVEVFKRDVDVTNGKICPSGTTTNAVDSIKGKQYYVTRSITEDKYGSRIIAGGYTDIGYFSNPRGNEGFFITKIAKNGTKLWSIRSITPLYNRSEYSIIEQVIPVDNGYTYVLGHFMGSPGGPRTNYIETTNNDTIYVPAACVFIMKLSPNGKILWTKTFHNDNNVFYNRGHLLKGVNDDLYLVTYKNTGYSLFSGEDFLLPSLTEESGCIIHMNRDGKILRKRMFPIYFESFLYSPRAGNYDDFPEPIWQTNGHFAFYGTLNTKQMSSKSIDDFPIPFDIEKINSALLFFDTSSFKFTSIKPIYKSRAGLQKEIDVEAFTIDSAGNYYASHTDVQSEMSTAITDQVKYKNFLSSFDSTGTIRWVRKIEGLIPRKILIADNKLKIGGTNYFSPYKTGYAYPFETMSSNSDSLKKITFFSSVDSYTGTGVKGLGSIDLITATLNLTNGELIDLLHLGTSREDEAITINKGYGDQLWLAGTVGVNFLDLGSNETEDTSTKVYTYKIPLNSNCNSQYDDQKKFLELDMEPESYNCIDSLFRIVWSSAAVDKVNIYYRSYGSNTYSLLAKDVPASQGEYFINPETFNITGNVYFKIEAVPENLSDTTYLSIYKKGKTTLTINASQIKFCRGTIITITATPENADDAPIYQWLVNDQDTYHSGNTFTSDQFRDQWKVQVIMFTKSACRPGNWVASNAIFFSVGETFTSVVLSGNTTINAGTTSLITTDVYNGGNTPQFQWQDSTSTHGWQNILNATGATINYKALTTGDKLRCILTSAAECANPSSVNSKPLTFTVNHVTAVNNISNNKNILVYPNPVKAILIVDSLALSHKWEKLDIVNITGAVVVSEINVKHQTKVTIPVLALANGIYLIRLTNKNGKKGYYRFIKQ